MGLAEQILAGAKLERTTVTYQTDSVGSGSVDLGLSYALLDIRTSVPCRLRLYDNQSSMENAGEIIRSFGDLNISASVALIGDFSMSFSEKTYTTDPIMYAVVNDTTSRLTYYRVEGAASPPQIQITRYLIEDSDYPAGGGAYSVANRRTFKFKIPSLNVNISASGALSGDASIPQTYLLVSASLSGSNNVARLRLYSNSSSLYDETEKFRKFENEPSASVPLIVDAFLSGSEITYFVPKIVGANLQNMGSNLTQLRTNPAKMQGNHELYYIIENKSSVATEVTASLHVYSLED